MRAILLFAFLFSFEIAFCQSIQLEIFNFDEIGELKSMFITDDDKLVISGDSGIFLLDDTTILQRISPNPVNAFKGRFGNVLFASGQHDVVSWTPNGSYTFFGDSSNNVRDMYKAVQLPDGRIVCIPTHLVSDLLVFDSTTSVDINGNTKIYLCYPWVPFVEVNPNLYFTKLTYVNHLGYFDATLDTLIEYHDSLFVSNPYGIIHAAAGKNGNMFMTYPEGIIEVKNNTVQTVAYFSPLGFSISGDVRIITSCSYMGENYVVISPSHLIFYKNGTIQLYGSAEGYNLGIQLPYFKGSQFNSNGVLYAIETNNLLKITSPLTSLKGDINESQNINVSPNPFTKSLKVNNLKSDTEYFYTISEPGGKILLEAPLAQNHRIDLNPNLSAGMYFLKIIEPKSGFEKSIRIIKD